MFKNLLSRRGLSLERLRALVEVYEAGSIAQTAPGNSVRHSQYSRQLRELSEFFGREVVERRGKTVKLTAEGEQLAQTSRQFMTALDDLTATFRQERLTFAIAAGDSLVQWLVVPRLGSLLKDLPNVVFAPERARTREIVQRVSDLQIDFGLVRKDAVGPGLRVAGLGSLGYVAAVPLGLAGPRKNLSLRDVFRLPVALQDSDGQWSKQVFQIARSLVPTFQPAMACQSFPQTMAAVRSGHFAAILPELAVTELPVGAIHKVSGPPIQKLKRDIVLIWSKRMTMVRPMGPLVAQKLSTILRFR